MIILILATASWNVTIMAHTVNVIDRTSAAATCSYRSATARNTWQNESVSTSEAFPEIAALAEHPSQ